MKTAAVEINDMQTHVYYNFTHIPRLVLVSVWVLRTRRKTQGTRKHI